MAAPQAPTGGTITLSTSTSKEEKKTSLKSVIAIRPANMSIPLRGSTVVKLAAISCIFFVVCVSMAFLGADADEPFFKSTLDSVAQTTPGVIAFILLMHVLVLTAS